MSITDPFNAGRYDAGDPWAVLDDPADDAADTPDAAVDGVREEAASANDTAPARSPLHVVTPSAGVGATVHTRGTVVDEATVNALVASLREWQDVPDPAHVLAALAVAVTAEDCDGEPAWLLLVAPPSSGKTETVRLLDDLAAARLDEVSIGGLLSWSKRKGGAAVPSGVLARVTRGLLTLGDLSTLLATSDRGGRDQVFAALRRVYDGALTRDVAPPTGGTPDGALSWAGRLTVVGAVTGAIDHYSAHADALGARWLYLRLPAPTMAAKRRASRRARDGELDEHRTHARALAARVVTAARTRIGDAAVSDDVADAIEDAALVTCWGRATVPRHGYGRREIDGPATVEEPPRLVRQLHTLARGLLALDVPPDETAALCRRVALDSMPAARSAVLDVLALRADNATTAAVARAAELDRSVTRRALEELEAVGVAAADRDGPDLDDETPDRRPCRWRLHGEGGALISEVFTAATAAASSAGRCCET